MQLCLKHSEFSFEELTSNFTTQIQVEKESMNLRTRRQGKLDKLIFSNRLFLFLITYTELETGSYWLCKQHNSLQISSAVIYLFLVMEKIIAQLLHASPGFRISDLFLIHSHRLDTFAVICLLLQQIYNLIVFFIVDFVFSGISFQKIIF